MSTLKNAIAAVIAATAAAALAPALAQSTDGYHSIQVFPVVVDSATFTQRFTFRNPDPAHTVTVVPRYFPGTGTSQATPLICPEFEIPEDGQRVFTSLRELCPGLAAGGQFGYLYSNEVNSTNRVYAAFSRVSNFAGNGFSIEAFPAHTFTAADSAVTGVRRLSATASAPAYQTNCFLGNLHDVAAPANAALTRVDYTLYSSLGVMIGSGFVDLAPGKLTRLLDVFAAAGVAPGDQDDVRVIFRETGATEPGLMTFCTVQDNSSFGADFRIGKQEMGKAMPVPGLGSQDAHVSRDSDEADDGHGGLLPARQFVVPIGQATNTHIVYFRHPDWVQCEIIDPATGLRATPAYGLEMRLATEHGLVIAGGAGSPGFGKIYLGDKTDRNSGANSRYSIQVESSGVNATAVRPYRLHCQSGSGHTPADLVRYQQAGDQF